MNTRNAAYQPQQVVLTLYSDYVLHTGGGIAMDTLIKLLSNFDLSPQAVRSATSRMSKKGLLVSKKIGRRSYYALTGEGRALLTERAQRVSQRKTLAWDGNWNIITYSIPERTRDIRDAFRRELTSLGYGPLSEATWISPYDMSRDVTALAKNMKIEDCVQLFSARQIGESSPQSLVNWCWHIDKIQDTYSEFIRKYQPRVKNYQKRLQSGVGIEPNECFVERFHLIRDYRRLPFFDRDLPQELLPQDWLRPQVAALFEEYHKLLYKKANEYFDSVFEMIPAPVVTKNRKKALV
jgi:phenylacetic acid degradation operon negative regulatory protein